jgi:hypothetical protein
MRVPLWVLSCVLCCVAWGCSDLNPLSTFDETECRRIAVAAVEPMGWGAPVTATYKDGWYEFRFETPLTELPLLGERTVRVHCGSGTATLPPRY